MSSGCCDYTVGLKKFLTTQIICFILCMTSLLADRGEDLAQEFMEHMLRISDPNRVLNTVLGRLQQKQELIRSSLTQETKCNNTPELVLPEYTESLELSRDRPWRQLGSQKHYPICHMERKIRRLNTNEYEYRPAYYEEIHCTTVSRNKGALSNEICSSLGFSCIQWNKTIHLTRRPYTSECWETKTAVIPAGCECMWPVHHLGEITHHV